MTVKGFYFAFNRTKIASSSVSSGVKKYVLFYYY